MKKILFSIGFLALLQSCEPEIVCTNTCDNKRIRNIESNGVNYAKLIYDDNNKQIFYQSALDTLVTYNYDVNSVEMQAQQLKIAYVLEDEGSTLPNESFAITSTSTGSSIGGPPNSNIESTYSYDAGGHLLTKTDKQGTVITKQTNTWVSGNLTKSVITKSAGTPALTTITYTYYPTIINSISGAFQGIRFLGKSAYNAPKTMTIVATGLPVSTTNYTYETDNCGCITKAINTTGTSTISRDIYYEKSEN